MTIGTYVAMAAKQDAERSRTGGDLGWYLRHEFRGGATFEAILADHRAKNGAFRAALRWAVKQFRDSLRQTQSTLIDSDH